MNSFTIGDTDFGVDATQSAFSVQHAGPDRPLLTLELRGDPAVFDTLTQDEDAEWSWVLYPPHLYIRALELPVPALKSPTTLSLETTDDLEAAIYLMEHNLIFRVSIVIYFPLAIEITGSVDVMGEEKLFTARLENSGT